ncbi:triple QxxK/R motif-containing protein isoform X1 [Paroedura picta]|uniref:triple QxxK/R motif-containing protein isoform X1 n=1 Tax=Paroedura picta TaxID=143630 RepID=UPI00101592B9
MFQTFHLEGEQTLSFCHHLKVFQISLQYPKWINVYGKQDYKKTRPMLKATRLKAEAKKTAPGIKEVSLVLVAILVFLLACYAFFYLKLSEEVDLDLEQDEN